jgi:hypothetical protein
MGAFSPAFKKSIEERIKNGSLRVSGQPPVPVNAVVSKLPAINRPSSGGMDSLTRLRALGRMKDGKMNKTEEAYSHYLEALRACGDVVWWIFESIKLRLADNTFYTVDFFVMASSGQLEAHDVKGAKEIIMDDAKVKIKVAASMYPFVFKIAIPQKKSHGGGWNIEVL